MREFLSMPARSMPGAVVGAERGLVAFGVRGQLGLPARLQRPGAWIGAIAVDGRAPGTGDRCDVGRAALPALDLQRRHAGLREPRQQLQGVEAGRLLQRVEDFAADVEAALAYGRVAGR